MFDFPSISFGIKALDWELALMNIIFPQHTPHVTLDDLYRLDDHSRSTWRSNLVTGINGAIEIDNISKRLSGKGDRQVFSLIRAYADGVMVGANTAIAEGYTSIPPLPENLIKLRQKGDAPVLIVASDNPIKLKSSRLIKSDREIIIVTSKRARTDVADVVKEFTALPKVIFAGNDRLDLRHAKRELENLGIMHVVLEGGPNFLGSCLKASLIEEIAISIAPIIAPNRFGGFLGPALDLPVEDIILKSVVEDNGTLILLYQLK